MSPRRRSPLRAFIKAAIGWTVSFFTISAVLFVAGYLAFAVTVANWPSHLPPFADAMVVLTGGAERMEEAFDLLSEHRASRLLISGVHPLTTGIEMQKRLNLNKDLFGCCVDLDYAATDTESNARETARWVEAHDFKSLIVVTSAYHMPRSLAELSIALPNTQLIPYPVYHSGLDLERWYLKGPTARLILQEYLKFLAVELRRWSLLPERFAKGLAAQLGAD